MPEKKIEKLEQRVGELIAEFDRLAAENHALREKVAALEAAVARAEAESQSLQQKAIALKRLEVSNQRMEKQQGMVRLKVQNLLDNLEKMDIP